MPYAWTNGFRTWYEEAGPPGAPAVVLIHGHSFDRTLWAPQVAALQPSYRVVTYDLRGHGQSEIPASGYWSAVYAEDLRQLLDALAIERAVLVGHSVGGSTIVHFALEHPDRVTALVIADSAAGHPPESHAEKEMHRLMWEITAARGIRPAMEQVWLAGHIFDGVRKRPEVYALAREMCLRYSGQGFRDPRRQFVPRGGLTERFSELRGPCLVIYGDLDHVEVFTAADAALRDIPHSERVVIQDAGHLANQEEPALFNAALLAFLQRHASPTTEPPA